MWYAIVIISALILRYLWGRWHVNKLEIGEHCFIWDKGIWDVKFASSFMDWRIFYDKNGNLHTVIKWYVW